MRVFDYLQARGDGITFIDLSNHREGMHTLVVSQWVAPTLPKPEKIMPALDIDYVTEST